MSRGLGTVQRAVLEIVDTNRDGIAADAIGVSLYGESPTRAQMESIRRAIRSLRAQGLVEVGSRREGRPRKSLKRFVDLAPCVVGFCDLCGQRKRRVRLDDWHTRSMRANAKHDPAWLDDLTLAKESGFVHATASAQRIVEEKPNAVDQCLRRLQFVFPASAPR